MKTEMKAAHTPTPTSAETKFFFKVIGKGPYQVQHKSGVTIPLDFPTVDRADDLINNIKDKVNWDFDSFDNLPYWVRLAIGEKVRDIYDRMNNEGYLS